MSLALSRDWNYDDQPQFGLGVMDLRMAPTNSDGDGNSRDQAFFTYIQRMERMSKPYFCEASVWLWIHEFDVRAWQSADFVKRFMPEYESTYSVYHSSRNEHLNDAKTHAFPAAMYLLFLLKRGDDRASRLRQNVKTKFAVPSDVPYYLEVGRYNEVKYRVEPSKLKMEFYLEIMKLFCRVGENFVGIYCGLKCLLTAKVCHFLRTASSQSCIILDSRIWWFPL